MLNVEITHSEWRKSRQKLPGPWGVAMDYATLAFSLLEGTEAEPVSIILSNPEPGVVRVAPKCADLMHSGAAAVLLEEYWLPELFPIGATATFGTP